MSCHSRSTSTSPVRHTTPRIATTRSTSLPLAPACLADHKHVSIVRSRCNEVEERVPCLMHKAQESAGCSRPR